MFNLIDFIIMRKNLKMSNNIHVINLFFALKQYLKTLEQGGA